MQIKGWRLSAAFPFVNAAAGISLLFTTAGCDRPVTEPDDSLKTPVITGEIELPAIWSTPPLSDTVRDVALSDGAGGLLAVAYENGGLEFFNLEGDQIGERGPFRLRAVADGRAVTIADTAITLFPAVTEAGELKAYIFGEGLLAPAQIDLPVREDRRVAGLCTGEAGSQGLIRLAYWTISGNRELRTGLIREAGGDLVWAEEDTTDTGFAILSCTFAGDTLLASPRSVASAALNRQQNSALISLETGGPLELSTDLGMTTNRIRLRDGITIRAPVEPTAVSASATLSAGGFPGGVIAVAGETSPGSHQVVFVDPTPITRPGN